ncbi:formylglycine-generating enzyme family protein [Endothiovibrio diazotrophicus]
MPVRYRQRTIETPGADRENPLVECPTRPLRPAPAYPYLAPFSTIVPRLRAALAEGRPGGAYDLERIVERVGRGEPLGRLPRRDRPGWGASLYVIEDRNDRLAPYLRDQAMVHDALRALYPARGFFSVLHSDLYDRPLVHHPDGTLSPLTPLPGDQVLVLGDLGALAIDGGRAVGFWADYGAGLRDAGAACFALLPCAPAECPPAVATHFRLLSWEHPAPPPLDAEALERLGERLLNHLSVAGRIEPGLLRAVRLALGGGPARLEAWVWQHPAMAAPDVVATSLEHDEARERTVAFEGEEEGARLRTLKAVREWLAHRPYEIWLERLVNLGPWVDEADFSAIVPVDEAEVLNTMFREDRGEGRRLLTYLAERVGSGRGAPLGPRARAWVEGVVERMGETVRDAEETAAACRALERWHDGMAPVGEEVELLRWRVEQRSGQLFFVSGEKAVERGSPVASLLSADGWIEVLRGDPFWLSGEAPEWADAWGEDAYGPWVEFVVERVRQRMRWCPPGAFLMGSPEGEAGRWEDEGPQHPVAIESGFWLFDTPVTQALWETVTGSNPSRFTGQNRPVEKVSWEEAKGFVEGINRQVNDLALELPSEARWEYACRAGTETARYSDTAGSSEETGLDFVAWYGENSGRETHPVGEKHPNPWGFHDMLGNVREWTEDGWHEDYRDAPADGSARPAAGAGAERVIRGGSWFSLARDVRAACRDRLAPGYRVYDLGFRCARVQAGAEPGRPAEDAQAERADRRGGRGAAVALHGAGEEAALALPAAPMIRLRSDREEITLRLIDRPEWAAAMGRDRFGLWSEIEVAAESGPPVVQRLRWCPPGRFRMGSPEDEQGRYDFEGPLHTVTLEEGFWLFDTPVTQALWVAVMGENPSDFQSPERPVEKVSWEDAQAFIERINQRDKNPGLSLPSEAQWEYACRAGTETAVYTGALEIKGKNNAPALDPIAWYGGNSGYNFDLTKGRDSSGWPQKQYDHAKAGTRQVKGRRPNAWGLHDMLGNVWEWTEDHWQENYDGAPEDGSARVSGEAGAERVIRGGSWRDDARRVRAACRLRLVPGFRGYNLGFRCARVQA